MKIGSIEIQPVQTGIIILTLFTAIIHFSLGEPLFILNGLGYLALLAAYFLPIAPAQRRHRLIRWLFAGYIILTIILYFVVHSGGHWQQDGLGLATKMIEVILLLLLAVDGQSRTIEKPDPAEADESS